MGLTSAMYTAMTGLNASQVMIDTAGDNIANVNTTAFKSNRANFETQMSLTLSEGTAPGDVLGGTNPTQIGRGCALAGIQRNCTGGTISPTGLPSDLAIQGDGFFVVETSTGQAYTRDGTFQLDSEKYLVTSDGYHVQGYGVDANGEIATGTLTDIQIPVGSVSAAKATSKVEMDGNLNADGTIGTQGTILTSQAFQDKSGQAATADTLLTDVVDPTTPGVSVFAVDDVLTTANVCKGGRQLAEQTFTVTATSTLGDYAQFLQNSIGINTDPAVGGTPGVRISDGTDGATAGSIVVEGNEGEDNAISIDASAIRSSNVGSPTPFSFTQTQEANGESVYTSFITYDSLGTPVQVDMVMVLDSKSNAGNTWRYYTESRDSTNASPVLGQTGTLTFDTDGQLSEVAGNTVEIPRENTGALTPMQIQLNFDKVTGLTTEESAMVMSTQDGFATGTLNDWAVGSDGIVTGTFSNGLTRQLGQVVLATFTNPEGLVGQANNLYTAGPDSGAAAILAPKQLGAGSIVSSSLELSNVDLTNEFIGLINASTSFSASGRVISTSNDMLNELMLIAR